METCAQADPFQYDWQFLGQNLRKQGTKVKNSKKPLNIQVSPLSPAALGGTEKLKISELPSVVNESFPPDHHGNKVKLQL